MNTPLNDFLSGRTGALLVDLDGTLKSASHITNALIFPGSFNPMHHGHARMLQLAERMTNRTGYLEISIQNVDKPALKEKELLERIQPLKGTFRILLTHAARFIEKAQLFNRCVFLMGYDTAKRLLNPSYCQESSVEKLLSQFQQMDVQFIIAGRSNGENFLTCKDLNIPVGFDHLFIEIEATLFRADISSTEIRKNRI